MKKLLIGFAVSTLSLSAIADHHFDLNKRFGLGGGLGYAMPVWGNNFDDANRSNWAYNLHGRYNFSSANAVQINASRFDFKAGPEGFNQHVNVYDALYIHRCNATGRFSPIWGAGAGVADFSNADPFDNLKLALKARAGAEYALTHNLYASVTVDYQYINNMPGSDSDAPQVDAHAIVPQANLTWYFGQAKDAAAPAAVAAVAAMVDGDTDGDGVLDSKDKCPKTAAGKTVNAYGCEAQEKAHIEVKVLFATGSAKIAATSHQELQDLATFLKEHPGTKAEIQGHTDSTGVPAKNKVLSQARADSVKNDLIKMHQVDAARLHAVGFGSEQPVADNKTVEGRNENRRVMAIISE